MAAAHVPLTRDLLSRLAAGTAGVVGSAFLRRLVAELGAALNAEVAFVAELVDERPGYARTVASATAPGIELGEGYEFELDGTPASTPTSASCCGSPPTPRTATRPTPSCAPTTSRATSRSRSEAPTAARSATSR